MSASPAARRSAPRSCRWRCSSRSCACSTRPIPASTSTRCKVVSDGVNALRGADRAMLVITHYQRLLEPHRARHVHVLSEGRIVRVRRQGTGAGARSQGLCRLHARRRREHAMSKLARSVPAEADADRASASRPAAGGDAVHASRCRALREQRPADAARRGVALHRPQDAAARACPPLAGAAKALTASRALAQSPGAHRIADDADGAADLDGIAAPARRLVGAASPSGRR